MQWALENRDSTPTMENYFAACQHINQNLSCLLSLDEVTAILDLFPFTKIKLARYGLNDPEVKAELLECISIMAMKCKWPSAKENGVIDAFSDLLKEQISLMGYKTK